MCDVSQKLGFSLLQRRQTGRVGIAFHRAWRSSPVFSTMLVGLAARMGMGRAKFAPGRHHGGDGASIRVEIEAGKQESADDDGDRPDGKVKGAGAQGHDR